MSDPPARRPVSFLVFAASLREGSLNRRLAALAAAAIEANGGTVDLASMREFDAPSYDNDVQDRDGFPPDNIVNFLDSVEAHRHYPCIKKAWVEYLGERPEPATDRVQ